MGFYRIKIGPFLAEVRSKTSRKASRLGVKRGGALIGDGTLNGEFTIAESVGLDVKLIGYFLDCLTCLFCTTRCLKMSWTSWILR